MRAVIKKWGNSAFVLIRKGIMQAARLSLNVAVDIREEGGCIVIEPIKAREFDLDQLVAGITPQNMHTEIGLGAR